MKKFNRFIKFQYYIINEDRACFHFPPNQLTPPQYIITQMWKCCNNEDRVYITDENGFETFDINTGEIK